MNNEPIAWINEEEIGIMYAMKLQGAKDWKTNLGLMPEENDIPLYTHPAKTLTDEEIWQITEDFWKRDWTTLDVGFAKAILRKAQEK
jgi:hypothetical protein